MKAMEQFTNSLGFIIVFIIGTLLISMTLGEKITTWYLSLVLISMVYANSDKLEDILKGVNAK